MTAAPLRRANARSADPGGNDSSIHRAIPIIVLAAVPWVMLAVNPSWIYSGAGTIDPWVYHGFFHFLREFAATKIGQTYYATRLAWILPGYAAYHWLPAHAANLTLHVGFLYVALASLYRATSILTNRWAALVAAGAFATTLPTIAAFGWDYVDGAVITYTLVALWAIVEASVRRQRVFLLMIAGAAAAGIIHSNVVAVLIGPALLIAYWCTHQNKRWMDLMAFVAGGVLATAALGAAHARLGGAFLFFMPSLRWAGQNAGTQTYDPVSPLQWPGSSRFVVPAIGLAAAIGAFAARRSPATRAALFMQLWLLAAFLAFDVGAAGGLLQTQYYVSWFLPFAFFAIAPAMGSVPISVGLLMTGLLVAAQIAGLGGIAGDLHHKWLAQYGPSLATVEISAAGLALLTASVAAWLARPGIRGFALALAIVVADFVATPNLVFGLGQHGRQQFDMVQQMIGFIREHVPPDRRPLFWLQSGGRNEPFFTSLASTHLYLGSIVSFSYPQFIDASNQYPKPGSGPDRGAYVIVLSDTAVDPGTAARELATVDLEGRIIAASIVHMDDTRFVMTLLQLN